MPITTEAELDALYQFLVAQNRVKDVPDHVFNRMVLLANRYDLDPYLNEIYLLSFKAKDGTITWTVGMGINGQRRLGARTGQYAGQFGPYWLDRDGTWHSAWSRSDNPVAAVVGIFRKGFVAPLWGKANWRSAAQTHPDGNLKGQWAGRGVEMLAKVAEANAWDRAFGDLMPAGVEADYESDEDASHPAQVDPDPAVLEDDPTGGIPHAVTAGEPEPEPEPEESEAEVATELAEELARADTIESLALVVRKMVEAFDSGLLAWDELGETLVGNAAAELCTAFEQVESGKDASALNTAYQAMAKAGLLRGESGKACREAREAAKKRLAK